LCGIFFCECQFDLFFHRQVPESLPTSFCNKCVKRLKIAYDFKFQCLLSQKHLNSFFQKITQDFHKSLPQAVFIDDDDEDLNQFDMVDSKREHKTSKIILVEETITCDDPNQSENFEEKDPIQEQKATTTESDNMKIIRDYNIGEANDTEPPEIYQQETEEIYDILEIEENSEDQNIGHLSMDKDSSMGIEENQLIYLNIKPESEHQFKIVTPGSETDDKLSNNPPKKRKVFKLENDAKEKFAKSTGDVHLCTKCNRSFSTRTNLYRHLQAHDGAKNYRCEICDKGFTQSGSLKQHYYIHTGLYFNPFIMAIFLM
jgi:hypothetical protein